jgi:putative sterol carrier protein
MTQNKEQLADEVMKTMVQKLNENKGLTSGWGKMVQQVFTDIGVGYRLRFAMDGTVTSEKVPASQINLKDAAATVTADNVETMKGFLDGSINPMEAMGNNLIKINGDMQALFKLLPAIG